MGTGLKSTLHLSRTITTTGQHLDPGGDHSPVYNLYTRSPTSPSGFTQMADQSDTLASSQLFICLELLLLLANILTLVEITLQSTTYTPGAQLVLVASLKWLTKVTHLPHVNSSFV